MNAPIYPLVPRERPFAAAVAIEEISGTPRRITLPHNADVIVIPLGTCVVSAFPGIAPSDARLGTVMFVPARTCAQAGFDADYSAVLVYIDPRLRQELDAALGASDLTVPDTACVMQGGHHVRALVQMMRRLAARRDPGADVALRAIVELVLHEIAVARAALEKQVQRVSRPPRLQSRHLRKIDSFIEQNLENPLRIGHLADLVGMSRYHFLRCFKRATGISPLQYVLGKRVERARRLLADSEESIAAIAYASGFSSQSHLNAMFKRHLGVTPGAFLREHRGTGTAAPKALSA